MIFDSKMSLHGQMIGNVSQEGHFFRKSTVAFGGAPGPQRLLRGSGDGLRLAAVECTKSAVRNLVFVFAFVFAFVFTSVFAAIFI